MKNALIVTTLLVIVPSLALAACPGINAQVTDKGSIITAAAEAPGCDGLTFDLKEGDCLGTTINSCTPVASICAIDFSPPWTSGEHEYVFCLDEDKDGIYEKSSEAKSVTIAPGAIKSDNDNSLVLPLLAIAFVIALIMYLKERKRKLKKKARRKHKHNKRRK